MSRRICLGAIKYLTKNLEKIKCCGNVSGKGGGSLRLNLGKKEIEFFPRKGGTEMKKKKWSFVVLAVIGISILLFSNAAQAQSKVFIWKIQSTWVAGA